MRREPNPDEYGVLWLNPYLRVRRGHRKRAPSCRQEALWASCPVLWRRSLRPEDTMAADSYVCWTWKGSEIPHEDWDPTAVPVHTPHLPWYEDLPREEAERARALLRGIEQGFLPEGESLEDFLPAGEALEGADGPISKRLLFATHWKLEELLGRVNTLPEELRLRGQEYLKSLERFFGL